MTRLSQKAPDPTGGQDPAQSQSTLEWMVPLQDGKHRHLAARRGMRGGHAAMPVPYRQLAPDAREPSFSLRLNDVTTHAGYDTLENVLCGHVDCATDKSPTSWEVTSRFRGSDG
ncbi:hypothetical protein GN958_ATG02488 [Phytophthora infestans]|uniref:Uncharacterized protein n=1 Tax=Phytophthora infestans TaxID=4787 RepID=A0A8S9VAC6_PHYIN|nr:hypothetical protein GN958_ATG02488 [Phytophthora infestans]